MRLELGSIAVSAQQSSQAGGVDVAVKHNPSNLAASNIAVFDSKQSAESKKLLDAVKKAATAYFEYCNRPHEDVRAESSDVEVGVNARAGMMDGDKPKKAAPKADSKKAA